MRGALKFVLTLVVMVCIMQAVRTLFFTIYTVEGDALEPLFVSGDRVLVNKWSYGLRTIGFRSSEYTRWMSSQPERGDLVAFNVPMNTDKPITSYPVYVCFCTGIPGDTVRIGNSLMTVPGRMHAIGVTQHNIRLIQFLYNKYEGRNATIKNDTLYADGKQVHCASFTKDYFWMTSARRNNVNDSRFFGFVPDDYLIGKVTMLLYSIDPEKPFYNKLRTDRAFLFIQKTANNNTKH